MTGLISGTRTEIILYVTDMAGEVQFYRDILGLSMRYPKGVTDFVAEM